MTFRELIEEKGLTLDDIYDKIRNDGIQISRSTLNAWYYKQSKMSYDNVKIMSNLLGIEKIKLYEIGD